MKSRINKDEREISISELWWYVISKWKWLVIGMVVGALVMGVLGAYKAYTANNVEVPKEIVMGDLTENEQEEINELLKKYEQYQEELAKLENSYLMSLDYNKVTYYQIAYYVDTDYSYNYLDIEEDYTSTLVFAYKTFLHSDEIQKEIMNLGIAGLDESDLIYIYNVANEGNCIIIGVLADEKWSESILDTMSRALESYYTTAYELIGEHKLNKISKDKRITYADLTRSGQNYRNGIVNQIKGEIETEQAILNERQLYLYEKEIAEMDGLVIEETTLSSVDTENLFNKQYVFIGAMSGVFACVVMVVILFLTGKKIKTISEISQVYSVEIIGKILRDDACNKKIIKKINKIKTTKSEKEQEAYVVETIVNKCKKDGITEVAICTSTKGIVARITGMAERLNEVGIKCKVVDDICYDWKTLRTAVECNNVILTEVINISNREDFEIEIEICDKLSINIIGVIVYI